MIDATLYWLWLASIDGVGAKTQHLLLNSLGSPDRIYGADHLDLLEVEGIGRTRARSVVESRSLEGASLTYERCLESGIEVLTPDNPCFPAPLRQDVSMPLVLFARGDVSGGMVGMGIVGARRCLQAEKRFVACLARECVLSGRVVVSGMAKGIDSYAHTACLLAGGRTVAVLGCGVDVCYPREHDLLMKRIVEDGLVLSEYPPGTPPLRYHFPCRNRIIACLSDDLYVVGARKNSGANITARYAIQQGKRVYHHNE